MTASMWVGGSTAERKGRNLSLGFCPLKIPRDILRLEYALHSVSATSIKQILNVSGASNQMLITCLLMVPCP